MHTHTLACHAFMFLSPSMSLLCWLFSVGSMFYRVSQNTHLALWFSHPWFQQQVSRVWRKPVVNFVDYATEWHRNNQVRLPACAKKKKKQKNGISGSTLHRRSRITIREGTRVLPPYCKRYSREVIPEKVSLLKHQIYGMSVGQVTHKEGKYH